MNVYIKYWCKNLIEDFDENNGNKLLNIKKDYMFFLFKSLNLFRYILGRFVKLWI